MARGTSIKPSTPCDEPGCGHNAVTGATKCYQHLPHNQRRFNSAMYKFKNQQVQTAFEMMLRADDRLSLDNELALVRTCLAGVVAKCDAEDPSKMGPHTIAAITSLSSEVSRMCDVMSRLESKYASHVPMEVLLFFIQLVADTLTKHVDEDTAETCVSAILELPLPQNGISNKEIEKHLARQPHEPGTPHKVESRKRFGTDQKSRIEEVRAQVRALREEIGEFETDEELAPSEPVEEATEE